MENDDSYKGDISKIEPSLDEELSVEDLREIGRASCRERV